MPLSLRQAVRPESRNCSPVDGRSCRSHCTRSPIPRLWNGWFARAPSTWPSSTASPPGAPSTPTGWARKPMSLSCRRAPAPLGRRGPAPGRPGVRRVDPIPARQPARRLPRPHARGSRPQPADGSPSVTDLHRSAVRVAGVGRHSGPGLGHPRGVWRTRLPSAARPDRARPRRDATQSGLGGDGHARPSQPAELLRHRPFLSARNRLSMKTAPGAEDPRDDSSPVPDPFPRSL